MPGNKLKSIDKAGFTQILSFENADKIVHAIIFFLLAIFYQCLKDHKILKSIVVPFLISFMIEILQGIMPYGRTFDWFDLIANTVGILLAVGLIQSIKKAKS